MTETENQGLRAVPVWPSLVFLADWAEQAAHGAALAERLAARVAGDAPFAESPLDLASDPEDADLRALRDWIAAETAQAVGHANKVDPAQIRVRFTEARIQRIGAGGGHDPRAQIGASWCGIVWLRAGAAEDGAGLLRFHTPLPSGGVTADLGAAYLRQTQIDMAPQDGRLVLFPSYLLHTALPFRGTGPRLAVAFNTQSFPHRPAG